MGGTLTNPVPRSQGAILQFIETVFNLPSLGDDDVDGHNDNLYDMFDFTTPPAPRGFVPINVGNYTLPKNCS